MHAVARSSSLRTALVAALFSLLTPAFAESILDGPAYEGDFQLKVQFPGQAPFTQQGRASARLVPKDADKADFVLTGQVQGSGSQADLKVAGSYVADGWRSTREGDTFLAVARDGRITGGGGAGQSLRLHLEGHATATRFRLTNDVIVEQAQDNLPAGTQLRYTYDLRRARPASAPAAADAAGGCRMRTVPIAGFGGAMTMAQVPDCSGQ